MRASLWGTVIVGLLALIVAGPALVVSGAFGQVLGSQPFGAYRYDPPVPAPEFSLVDTSGKPLALRDLRGKYVLLYFGYSFCPDICPDTLFSLAQARKALGTQARLVSLVFITVDPDRDTPGVLARYVSRFDPEMIGLTGSSEEIAHVARSYGIAYSKVPYGSAGGYTVDHTAYIFLIDGQGRLLYRFDYREKWEDLAKTLVGLLR